MALTPTEQALYEFAKGILPGWFFAKTRAEEEVRSFVKIFDPVRIEMGDHFADLLILNAEGLALDEHAADRDTSRQPGESDVELRARLRTVNDLLTRTSILAAAEAISDITVPSGTVGMVELPRDEFFLRTAVADSSAAAPSLAGGVFSFVAGTTYKFEPDKKFARAPYRTIFPERDYKLVISGASSAGNDGTFPIASLSGDAAVYVNASGVAETDASVAWSIDVKDTFGAGNLLTGFQDSYLSRGDRIGGSGPPVIIIILPFGTTAGTEASVVEMLRKTKAAGVRAVVERRLT